MSDEKIEVENEPVLEGKITEQALQITQDAMDQFLATADVEAVYAEAIAHEKRLIIPAAEVAAFMGVGGGGGRGQGPKDEGSFGAGGGTGGGGKVFARPVAVIVSDEHGVRVNPVVDATKIYLAALTALGFITAAWVKMSRGKLTG